MFDRIGVRLALLAAGALVVVVPARAAIQYRVEAGAASTLSAPLRDGAKVALHGIPLIDGQPATLELERFEVWTPDADISIFGADQKLIQRLPRPDARYFRGEVAGVTDSVVFISVAGNRVEGLVYAADRKFAIGSIRSGRTRGGRESVDLLIEESSPMDDIPFDGEGFTCDIEKTTLKPRSMPRAVSNAFGEPVSQSAPTGTQKSLINLAVDTDYELFLNSGSSADNVGIFIGNLVGATSVIYQRDLKTEIEIAFLGIQSSSSDPFLMVPGSNGATTMDALLELGDRWHNSPPTGNLHSAVTLISGKSQGAGVAWVNTLCYDDFSYSGHWGGRYSYCGGIRPPGDLSVPNPDANAGYTAPSSNYWPLLELAHELGHNVGSDHSHCVGLTAQEKTLYGVTRDFVDECYSGEGGCFTGTQLVPAEKGTIMSYCHLREPGYGTNTRYTFGKAGEASKVILDNMLGYMAGVTPSLSAITAPSSLAPGATGNASVINAGLTYFWTITNGTFSDGYTTASGANVSFSVTSSPATLVVTATNAKGCAVTDSVQVTSAVSLAAPTSFSAAVTSGGIGMSWSGVFDATSYEIFRSSDHVSFAQVGTTSLTSYVDATAAPNTAYLYKVRSAASGSTSAFSNSDVATNVVFTDPALTAGVSTIKAAHVTELRTAVNAMLQLAGQAKPSYTDAALTSVPFKTVHITELRQALTTARSALGLAPISYTDGTLSPGSAFRTVHIVELRNGVQ